MGQVYVKNMPHVTYNLHRKLLKMCRNNDLVLYKQHKIIVPAHLQKLSVKIVGHVWHIFNIYLPHNVATARLTISELEKDISDILSNNDSDNILIGGDFNCTIDPI